jgi:hypothetical protein
LSPSAAVRGRRKTSIPWQFQPKDTPTKTSGMAR